MQTVGVFFVTDVNQRIEQDCQEAYLEVDLMDVSAGDEGEGGSFRTVYKGSGIRAGKIYEITLDIKIQSNCSFESSVISFMCLE